MTLHIARTILAAAILLVASSCSTRCVSECATFVALDGEEIVALVYEDGTARIVRDGEVVSTYAAGSVLEALWGMDERCRHGLRGARFYEAALAPSDLEALSRTAWTYAGHLLVCAADDLDDCTPAAPLAPEA